MPGYEDEEHEPFEAWLAHDMQGPGDRPEATFVAVAGDEAVGYAKFSLSQHGADARPPRPDRGQARLARSRDRPGAEVGADRLGEGERLRAAADDERRAQHADAPAERAARLPAVDRAALPARAARVTETIATGAARAGLALAGAGRGAPRRPPRRAGGSRSRTTGPTSTTAASSPSGSGRWATSRPAGPGSCARSSCPRPGS